MRRTAPSRSALRAFSLVVVAALVLSAASPAALAAPPAATAPADAAASAPPTGAVQADAPDDPDSDTIGWEGGYWHNESIDVDQSDGLSDEELDAYVARSMARVEYIRDEEFDGEVPVEVISRHDYRNRSAGSANATEFNRWNDQVWEALFIVGESTESSEAIGQTTGSSVAGFYSPTDDEIKIITPNPETPTIDNTTLVHELVHALQDQQYDLTEPAYTAPTQDGGLAVDGVVEGEANYIEARYSQRCGEEWSCVGSPQSSGDAGGTGGLNLGIYLTIYNPYSDGPVYVSDIVEEEGWDGFEERFRNPPESTEQVIHLTDEEPVPIPYNDTAEGGWELYPNQGVNGSDTVGEASIFSMFWYQTTEYDADVVSRQALFETTSEYDVYDYNASPSAGWANDRVFPYHNGTGEDAEYGYVWKTEWDTEADATQFHEAYVQVLEAHEAERTAAGYYEVSNDPFADAFAVERNGTSVTIVNGPDTEAVSDIRPSLSPTNGTPTATPTETADPEPTTETPDETGTDEPTTAATTAADEPTVTTAAPETTETTGAGFGFAVAVVAVAIAGLLARFR